MIARIIRGSVKARILILLAAIALVAVGIGAVRTTSIDALPDLSDVQVIIRTTYPGQAPQIVENQVTYPLATTMLSVPGARVVRGYSFVGDSFVYVLFEDGTDLYWARSRVLEYLSQVQGRLPQGATASLGPVFRVLHGFFELRRDHLLDVFAPLFRDGLGVCVQ